MSGKRIKVAKATIGKWRIHKFNFTCPWVALSPWHLSADRKFYVRDEDYFPTWQQARDHVIAAIAADAADGAR